MQAADVVDKVSPHVKKAFALCVLGWEKLQPYKPKEWGCVDHASRPRIKARFIVQNLVLHLTRVAEQADPLWIDLDLFRREIFDHCCRLVQHNCT